MHRPRRRPADCARLHCEDDIEGGSDRPPHVGGASRAPPPVIVVVGWSEGSEGRKHVAGTALLGDDGELFAQAKATWISLAPAEPSV
jgi:hypothetical protein